MVPPRQVKKSKSKSSNTFSLLKAFIVVFMVFSVGIAAGFFVNKKFNLQNHFNTDKYIQQPATKKIIRPITTDTVEIYLLKGKKDQGITYLDYVPVKRTIEKGKNKFKIAINELLKGPLPEEKEQGYNTEIPYETKLLGITSDGKSYTINLSGDFQFGGGTDSMKARVYQLIKTATKASEGKDVYLELDGEKAEVIGGEGIIIKQPINKNL